MSSSLTMLDLASPRWTELAHAYGTAEDVPRLLEHLPLVSEGQRRELWIGLWHLLWRDGVVFPASLAAVPHLVAFAHAVGVEQRAVALHLAGAIVAAPMQGAPPPDLLEHARAAVATIPALVVRSMSEPWSPDATQVLCGVLAIARGHPSLGGAVLALEPAVVCAACGDSHPTPGWAHGALAPPPAPGES